MESLGICGKSEAEFLGICGNPPASACLSRTKHLYPHHGIVSSPSYLRIPIWCAGPYLQHIKMCPVLWHLCVQPCLDVRDHAQLGWQHEVHNGTEKVLFPDQNAQRKALQSPWWVLFPLCSSRNFPSIICRRILQIITWQKSPSPNESCSWIQVEEDC